MIEQMGQSDLFPDTVVKDSRLKTRFVVPPFSVLDARQGYWMDRKRAWIALGIHGGEGRVVEPSGTLSEERDEQAFHEARIDLWRMKKAKDFEQGRNGKQGSLPGSIFDPVLCEVVYRWFLPRRGSVVLDPFAGESTKGLVAGYLGHQYVGVELRPEQIAANVRQAVALQEYVKPQPTWLQGDSLDLARLVPGTGIGAADLIFTSPPYYDLEVYSADEADGSALPSYSAFIGWLGAIYYQAAKWLLPNRFFVVKVGEIRDKATGAYRSFVPDTVSLLASLGLSYYNEAILVTPVGSLPIRAGKQFEASRKLGKEHQNLLVFYKGNTRDIPQHFPREVEFGTAEFS